MLFRETKLLLLKNHLFGTKMKMPMIKCTALVTLWNQRICNALLCIIPIQKLWNFKSCYFTLPLCRGYSSRVRLAKLEALTLPGYLVTPLGCRGPWMSIVVLYCWYHSESASFFCVLHFCHTCSLCPVELVVQIPARSSTQVLLGLFPGVLRLWHFLYRVGLHPVSSLHIYTSVVSRAFIAGAAPASQAADADSSREHGITSALDGSVNVHHGALLLVPQWQCISSLIFYFWIIELFPVFT